jgi:hypothetical protein
MPVSDEQSLEDSAQAVLVARDMEGRLWSGVVEIGPLLGRGENGPKIVSLRDLPGMVLLGAKIVTVEEQQ